VPQHRVSNVVFAVFADGHVAWVGVLPPGVHMPFTTEPNDVVRPVHEKAISVILPDPAEQEEWSAGGQEGLRLQQSHRNVHRPRSDIGTRLEDAVSHQRLCFNFSLESLCQFRGKLDDRWVGSMI
jgi:hypothetical protein